MRIETSQIVITTEERLDGDKARAVRGFFGTLFNTVPAFHGHDGSGLIYRHPLIQYKVLNGSALLVGLKEGAYLLKAVPELQHVTLYGKQMPVVTQTRTDGAIDFGLCERLQGYDFVTNWIALNQANYATYGAIRDDEGAVNRLLTRILIGNMLSLSKAVGYVVDETIELDLSAQACEVAKAKFGVYLVGFSGRFCTNFVIPDNWGLGKFASRGYGTVVGVSTT
jgi:hypothetical protein